MKQSLGKKICAIGCALIVLFILLNIALTYFFMISFSVYLSQRQMEKILVTMENETSYEDEEFREYIESMDETYNTSITVIDGNKNIISTTKVSEYNQNTLGKSTSTFFENERARIDKGEMVSASWDREQGDLNLIFIKVIKKVADDRYVILSRSYRSLENAMHSAIVFDALAGIIIIIVGVLAVLKVSGYLVVPIRNMRTAAEHISNLEFDMRVEVRSEDELGQLGMSINKMSDHLEENLVQMQNDIDKRKRLVRNISHEIKSPIAVITGYADRLKAILRTDPEKATRYCEIISNESMRVDLLVREMLELSKFEQKAEQMQTERFPAGRIFEKIRECFQEETMEKHIVYTEDYDENETLRADFLLLERALNNLVRNAVTYATGEPIRIHVSGVRNGEFYEFCVFNTGSHIDESEFDSIWDAFTKVDKARTRGKGFGVGLSIVQEIVLAHEGYCRVKNTEDGVAFTIAVKG